MSTFYGLEISGRGLFASQKALDITGHNIANANTEGYARQSPVFRAVTSTGNTGLLSYSTGIRAGGGVEIQELRQIRDTFLDIQYRQENRSLQEWTVRTDVLSYVESIYNEPSEIGLNQNMTEFFNALQELSKYPESVEVRTLVRQQGIKLTEVVKHLRSQLIQLQGQQDDSIQITVGQISNLAENIRDLNAQIQKFELGGERANDLRDQRNLLLDELSGLINFSYSEDANGRFRIDINGYPLVNHTEVNLLQTESVLSNPVGSEHLSRIIWKDTQQEVVIKGGKLKAYLDMRDGITPDNAGIPFFIQQLDNFTKALVQEINYQHQQGYSIPNEGQASESGHVFFSFKGFEQPADWDSWTLEQQNQYIVDHVTAENITLDSRILSSVYNIAASSEEIPDTPDNNGWGNNLNALAMAGINSKKDIEITLDGSRVRIGSLEGFTKKLISDIAVEVSYASGIMEGQNVLAVSIDNRRSAVSGVSLDEEMANMIKYQHSYSASARMITAVDQMLEILITQTGLVGR